MDKLARIMTCISLLVVGVVLVGGQTAAGETDDAGGPKVVVITNASLQALGPTARVSLSSASARMTQTGNTGWTLDKTGLINTADSSVTWMILATEAAPVAGHLAINGTITVENTGLGGATIGNIVVNLQTKSGSAWVTRSSNVADATSDDAATSARVMAGASSQPQRVRAGSPRRRRLPVITER
jgi:predicted MFS family arabinose efflux permease